MIRPRENLSWSSMNLLETSEEMWKRVYFEGLSFSNKGMELGKEIAEALENNQETGDPLKDFVLSALPKFEIMEKSLMVKIKVGGDTVPLLSYLDSARADLSAFKEYKTGKTAWDQKKVDNHGQITFYCTVIRELTGKIPAAELIWAPTEIINGQPELTGEIKIFQTTRSLADILKMKNRMWRAWHRIGKLSEDYLI